METRTSGIVLILGSVCLLTVTQLLIKSRLSTLGVIPVMPMALLRYIMRALSDLPLLLGGTTLVIAALCWYSGISRLPLSVAFPLGALSYPLVLAGSLLVLREEFSWPLVAGNAMILGGIAIVAISMQS